MCLTLHSELCCSQILRIVDVEPLCAKSQKISDLIYTATESWNRASLHAVGRLSQLLARYKFKCLGPMYANSEGDNRVKIRGLTYKTCFSQNLMYIAVLHNTPPPLAGDIAPCSCIDCDNLKPAILIIAVTTIPALLFNTQSYQQANVLYSFIQYSSDLPKWIQNLPLENNRHSTELVLTIKYI